MQRASAKLAKRISLLVIMTLHVYNVTVVRPRADLRA
jgi:hypothetical protein